MSVFATTGYWTLLKLDYSNSLSGNPLYSEMNTEVRQQVFTSDLTKHGYTNPGQQVAMATKCFAMTCNISGSRVWDLLHVTLLALTES
jgi:hypothetical protein